MDWALAATWGGGKGAMSVAAPSLVAACWSDATSSPGPEKLVDGSSVSVLACSGPACCACCATSASTCGAAAAAAAAAGKSSREMPGEGTSLSWLSLLAADDASVTAGAAPAAAASPFCGEAEANGEVGIKPSLTCPFA